MTDIDVIALGELLIDFTPGGKGKTLSLLIIQPRRYEAQYASFVSVCKPQIHYSRGVQK